MCVCLSSFIHSTVTQENSHLDLNIQAVYRVQRDKVIGKTRIAISDLTHGHQVLDWFKLEPRRPKLITRVYGEIKLALHFIPN